MSDLLITGPDGQKRCKWVSQTEDFIPYHDQEWGFPVADDRWLFEKLCLESFQSGLSWRTILAKRDNFRAAFANFEIDKVAAFTDADADRLLQDAGIIRHKGKIAAVMNNAKRAQELVAEQGSLAAYVWSYEPKAEELGTPQALTMSVPCHVEGPEEARMEIRRPDDDLRLHAKHGAAQRPCGGVLHARAGGCRARSVHAPCPALIFAKPLTAKEKGPGNPGPSEQVAGGITRGRRRPPLLRNPLPSSRCLHQPRGGQSPRSRHRLPSRRPRPSGRG